MPENRTGQFFIRDIKNANAGNEYSSQHLDDSKEWVKPWQNIDGDSYKTVRGKDAILPVLNSAHQVQFTNFNIEGISTDFGQPGEVREGKDHTYIVGYPDMDNNNRIDVKDASYVLQLRDKKRVPTQEDLDKLNFYGDGPINPEVAYMMIMDYYSAISAGKSIDWFDFINTAAMNKYRDSLDTAYIRKHLRLIMPKYLRRVEVESLNRNFWVIGQTLSGITAYLTEDGSVYKTLLNGILDEITQLWENVLYLWAAAALVSQKPKYEDIKVIHCYLDNDKELPYLKYDNFDNNGVSTNKISERLKHYQDEFPKSNLIIIPEIRNINYKHNYYAKSIFPCAYIYNRNTGVESLKTLRQGYDSIQLDLTKLNWDGGGVNIDEKNMEYNFTKDWKYPREEAYYALIRTSVNVNAALVSDDIKINQLIITYIDISPLIMEQNIQLKTLTYTSFEEDEGSINCALTANSVEYDDYPSCSIAKGFYQGEILSYLKPPPIEFKVVKIGDFYPQAFLEDSTKSLSKVIMEKSDGTEVYDTQTYGIGAYVMRNSSGTVWPVPDNKILLFVDYNKYSQGAENYTVKGYDLSVDYLNQLSIDYICYLKKQGQLGNTREDGIYATKFGTTYWNGIAGSQWSSGIVHALVYYNGQTQTAKIIAQIKLFDGYWTINEDIFYRNVSQWRRLYLGCNFDIKNNTFSMNNGQLIWYDHWNDIDYNRGVSEPRPNMEMTLVNNQVTFSNPDNPLVPAETNMAVRIEYQRDGKIFKRGGSNIIGLTDASGQYNNGGPIQFVSPYDNIRLDGAVDGGTKVFEIN